MRFFSPAFSPSPRLASLIFAARASTPTLKTAGYSRDEAFIFVAKAFISVAKADKI
jgi:hypothetical protein